MRISELIAELQDALDRSGDLEVMTSYNYGDYHNTEALNHIDSVEEMEPISTAYSASGLCIPKDSDEEMEENQCLTLILRF
jgi:hypothetical protein